MLIIYQISVNVFRDSVEVYVNLQLQIIMIY